MQLRPAVLGLTGNKFDLVRNRLGDCVRIAAPANADKPVIFVLHPSQVGKCDDVSLDAGETQALAGGRPMTFKWTLMQLSAVPGGKSYNLTNATSVRPPKRDGARLLVPASAFAAPGLQVTLRVTTFLAAWSETQFRVRKRAAALPVVGLLMPPFGTRSTKTEMFVEASVPACAARSEDVIVFAFDWQVLARPSTDIRAPTVANWAGTAVLKSKGGNSALTSGAVVSFRNAKHSIVTLKPMSLK